MNSNGFLVVLLLVAMAVFVGSRMNQNSSSTNQYQHLEKDEYGIPVGATQEQYQEMIAVTEGDLLSGSYSGAGEAAAMDRLERLWVVYLKQSFDRRQFAKNIRDEKSLDGD